MDGDDARTEAELLVRVAAGEAAAVRVLAQTHLPKVLALAQRMLGNREEAEDVAQEAMMRLWRIAPEWRAGEARVATWLYRVASNLAIDRLRSRRPAAPVTLLDTLPDPAPGAEAEIAARERAAALERALLALPERQRLAIVLRHLEELPQAEVAAVMGVSVEAAESLLARGRRSLEAMLAPQRAALGWR
jgi:RNA polymerase sigma-70 factor (ECF subfamily)